MATSPPSLDQPAEASTSTHDLARSMQELALESSTTTPPIPNALGSLHPSTSQANTPGEHSATPQQSLPEEVEFRADIWFLKHIVFDGRRVAIVTQNFNGPCSFIAICNILILRGDIAIHPPDRPHASYEYLSQLVADYLLTASPEVDISAALSKMPATREGMDLNPLFTGVSLFRPGGDGGELKLFEQANIKLLHGWVVDPETVECDVVSRAGDYDSAINMIVAGDEASHGQLVIADEDTDPSSSEGLSHAGPSKAGPSSRLNAADEQKIEDALIVRQFLDSTKTQLTYHGLFSLAAAMKTGSLAALFRNSHLSVLYKAAPSRQASSRADGQDCGDPSSVADSEPADAALYSLVTDYSFLHEPSVVWERMEDVDGGSSTFVDSDLRRSSPAGGDWAGHTAESALAAYEAEMGVYAVVDPADHALARQLQAEEDAHAQQEYARRQQERQAALALQRRTAETESDRKKPKSKKDCIIM